MKKIINIIALIIVFVSTGNASQNIIYKWQKRNFTLNLVDNFGSTLSEKIREQSQREKAYYIFNVLSNSEKNMNIYISSSSSSSSAVPPKEPQSCFIDSLNLKEIEKTLGINLKEEENYCPAYNEGKLLNLRWSNNLLKLVSGDIILYQQEEAFSFLGKQKENILIKVNGKLKYLSEDKWSDIEELKDFTVSNIFKWVDENTIAAYVERDMTGKRFIVIAAIRNSYIELLPDINGRLVNIVVSPDKKRIFSLYIRNNNWIISEYSKQENRWSIIGKFSNRIYLLGVRKDRVIYFEENKQKISTLDGRAINDIESIIIKTYPEGNYIYGESEDPVISGESVDKIALFYNKNIEENLLKFGLNKIEKFSGNPEIWLLPENYKSDISSLPEDIGYVFLSLEDMRLYYDAFRFNFRNIGSFRLKPTFTEINILIFLGIVLLLLLLYALLKKAKEITT